MHYVPIQRLNALPLEQKSTYTLIAVKMMADLVKVPYVNQSFQPDILKLFRADLARMGNYIKALTTIKFALPLYMIDPLYTKICAEWKRINALLPPPQQAPQ
jgi:hypothetical protein